MLCGEKSPKCKKNLLKFNFDTFWGVYDQIVSSPLLYAIQQKKSEAWKNLKKFHSDPFVGSYNQIVSLLELGFD